MLKFDGLTKTFGTLVAVDNVSFEVPAGQMLGIIGRSGAGKSTLLRMINRLTEPTAGSIVLRRPRCHRPQGRELRLWRRECAMIFQQFNLVPRLDVLTNVLMGRLSYQPTARSLLKLFTPEERALAVITLDRVEMASFDPAARRPALRRPAAAGRDRPRAGAGTENPARRRAHRLARSAQRGARDGHSAQHQSR